ncbi:MAG: hypothetical protein ACI8RN_002430 [Glaciecola sp.]|jgi:hypothetical protein|uniref:hypothetical protein n=1 Tax=Congregibacter sp. TaxID=2744308 RepID=UPI0039E4CF43
MPRKTKQQKFAKAVNALSIAALLCGGFVLVVVLVVVVAGIVTTHLRDASPAPEVLALVAPHCSDDRAPSWAAAAEPFSIAVQAEAATLPEGMEQKIAIGADAAYAQWREWLGENALLHSRINIRFLGDEDQFRQIYGKPNTDEWTTTGFYRMRSNEALILYTPAYRATALGNAFHELSHLVTASHLGATPPWLNEGLAEYYETLHLVDGNVQFADNLLHLQMLRSQGPISISDMTALSRQLWMKEDAQRRYASAWSFITFMMHSDDGQRTLQRVVQQAYTHRCEARPDLRKALEDYPGGLQSLQGDWLAWLDEQFTVLSEETTDLAP